MHSLHPVPCERWSVAYKYRGCSRIYFAFHLLFLFCILPITSILYPLLVWASVLWLFYQSTKKGGVIVCKAFYSCGYSRGVLRKLQLLFVEAFVVVGYGWLSWWPLIPVGCFLCACHF